MTFREEEIELGDGRTLEVATMGDPSGTTIFFHHGTPGTTRTMKSLAGLSDFGEFFVVTTSRPGYGRSSRNEGRSVASVIPDLHAVLDHFGRDEYVALGWSGGGPHALASAALDPRCHSAVALASVAPTDADFDWTEGMGPENLEEFALAQEGGAAYEELMSATGDILGAVTKDNIVELMGGLLSEPDRDALSDGDVRELFAVGLGYGFVNGWRGYFDDNVAVTAPWGFDVSDITVPVHLFYGDDDLMVPAPHGTWLSKHVANAPVTHHPKEGHISIFANHLDEVASALTAS
jgi:pimeloyl-ACP methyl ester carboxylesterase